MPDKDEWTEQFHDMKQFMTPNPELLARLEASLATPETTTGDEGTPEGSGTQVGAGAPQNTPTQATPGIVTVQAVETPPVPTLTHSPTSPTRPTSKPLTPRSSTRPGRWGRRAGGMIGALASLTLVVLMIASSVPSPLISGIGGQSNPAQGPGATTASRVSQGAAADYQDLYNTVVSSAQSMKDAPGPLSIPGLPVPASPDGNFSATTSGTYSQTNVQVDGIDEADFVKTDGTYLYICKGSTVWVVSAAGSVSRHVATIDISALQTGGEVLTGPVVQMMISGSTLILFAHGFATQSESWGSSGDWVGLSATSVKAIFYDISDPVHPVYQTVLSQSGSYAGSRLSDGTLYLVSQYWVDTTGADPARPVTFAPTVDTGDGPVAVSPADIQIMPRVDQPSYCLVTAINVAQRSLTSEQAVLGRADTLYMSTDNIYVASSQWNTSIVPGSGTSEVQGPTTSIIRLAVNGGNLTFGSEGSVSGTLLNQYSLDQWNGYLRVATTGYDATGNKGAIAGLWVLDSSGKLVGSIPDLASGESVQSVRFDGPVGYVVTFRQRDPLFSIDLTDPTSPTVLSALKIPGFSTYLHPFGDGLLLGVGVDTDDNGASQGLKLSMFNISDPYDVAQISTTHIDADSTEVSQDPKAVFADLDRGLIGLPTVSSAYTPKSDGTYNDTITWNYLVYAWTGSAFTQKAQLTIYSGPYTDLPSALYDPHTRGIRIGDYFYVASSTGISVYTMDGYGNVGTVAMS
ncbi:MAG: beta-propeller domain-containing protein [Propionibacteriaceae bacterium]|nr:beta-propeller domain-containing protein [Propionibacteriaceae bacterium]